VPSSPTRSTSRGLLLAALLLLALVPAALGAQVDVIRGRVTNAEGLPLPNVRVTATSIPGNVVRETRTDGRGGYQIAFANGTGDYMMSFALIGYVYRQFQLKRLADEDLLVADARLGVVQFDTVQVVSSTPQRVGRNERTPDVGGTERPVNAAEVPPEAQGDIAAMAASLPGVLLVPGLEGEADGFSVLGLGADQNSVTLNGGMQLGANGLPRDANVSGSLATSPYDVSRGGFAGANLNFQSGSGSNYRRRGLSLVLNRPELQWTDPAARALGSEYTNVSLGGVVSGPIRPNKAFYNLSWQLGRNARDNQTLLGTSALGLQTAGVALDSVARFVGILDARGVPVREAAATYASRVSDNGSLFASVDLSPPTSTSGHSYTLTANGSWSRQRPVGGSATQLPSASGERMSWSGGVQLRHAGYLGMLLSESSIGVSRSGDDGDPFLALPAGRVRVNSVFADGGSGVQSLVFGGHQGLDSRSSSVSTTAQHTLSWFDDANKHRIKLAAELQYQGSEQRQASNLLGTFTFNSLEDLEAGRPASFSRTLTARDRTSGVASAALSIGDSWRRTPDLQLQYGVRVDASRFTASPAYNAAVERAFGRRNDRVPAPLAVSPRVGFSWTLGRRDEIESFFGAARAPRAVLRGGLGLFANAAGQGPLGQALDNTGLASGIQQVYCVGPAAPVPDWAAYARDPGAIPDRCLDGGTGSVFSNAAPNVTLVAPGWRPPRTLRGNLSWNGSALDDRLSTSVEGTWSLALAQQRVVDLNFVPTVRFSLDGEGRPVYVEPTSIVAATGAVAARDARLAPEFSRVTELRSDFRARTTQLALRVSPIQRGPSTFGWSLAYTWTHIREQVAGFGSTAGNPLDVEWVRAAQGPHQISYGLRWTVFHTMTVNWNGSIRSGASYTPMVAGDVNGDGYGNDRAFVYAPDAAPDSALADGMRRLLDATSGGARACLEGQLGHVAARNSCRAPWSSTASLTVTLDRVRFRMPQRANVSFALSNPLGAADLLINGSGRLRGWGQTPTPDQALLYVRGFDAAADRFRYEVNQRFGATRPQWVTLRSPVTLTTSVRLDLGPVRERQQLAQQLNTGRTLPGTRNSEQYYRQTGGSALPNPMTTILRQADSLRLTATQADSIASMNRRYTYRADSLWAPVARWIASLPSHYDEDEVHERWRTVRRAQVDMLMHFAPLVRALLTPEQRRKLPPSIANVLDTRYLYSIRNGTGLYVGAGR